MPTESFEVWTVLPTSPEQVYKAWLDEQAHAAFTGGQTASIDPVVGGRFTAWGGYIEGRNQELDPGRRIVQAWRTSEFSGEDPDSILELVLEPHDVGTRLTIRHSNVPEGQGKQYEEGWHVHYFVPMAAYFGGPVTKEEAPPRLATPRRAEAVPEKKKHLAPKAAKQSRAPGKRAPAKPVKKAKTAAAARRPATKRKPRKPAARRKPAPRSKK